VGNLRTTFFCPEVMASSDGKCSILEPALKKAGAFKSKTKFSETWKWIWLFVAHDPYQSL